MSTDNTAPVRLFASSSGTGEEDRLDRLLHTAAQLSDDGVLTLVGKRLPTRLLNVVAEAYGLGHGIVFTHEVPTRVDGLVVYSSRVNALTAPLRPNASAHRPVAFDDRPGDKPPLAQLLEPGEEVRVVRSMAELIYHLRPGDRPAPLRAEIARLAGHRVGFVTNYPTHYRVALLNLVAHRLEEVGASLRVFFTDSQTRKRGWMRPEEFVFSHEYLPAFRIPVGATDLPIRIRAAVKRFRPTLLVVAGFSPSGSSRVARIANRQAISLGVWNGGFEAGRTASSALRREQRKRMLRRANFVMAYGYRAAEYLHELAPDLPSVYARNSSIFPGPAAHNGGAPAEILAVAQAVPRKRLDLLIDALRLVPQLPCRLTIAGAGPELARLRARATDPRIRLLGAVPSNEVHGLFETADVFAFPSEDEPFGLALVEAFAAGLAVAASSAPGAVSDLAVPERNCLIVEEKTPQAWATAIGRLVEDPALRRRLGAQARATVLSRWTLDHSADAVISGFILGTLTDPRSGRFAP